MYNSQYYTCEEIDQRLLQNYLDDYNSQNNTSLTKAQFLQALYNMFNNGLTLGNIVQMAGSNTDKVMSQAVVTELIEAVANAINEGSLYLGILPPSANPGSHTTNVFALVKEVGTYTYFKDQNNQPIVISNEGVYIFNYNVGGDYWISTPLFQIDTKPTPNSTSLVRSGSILNSIIKDGSAFDLSAYNNGATYNSLSAALTAMNALPSVYKQGGMSIKYVSTSDNKYVQFRYMSISTAAADFTNVDNWQGIDVTPTAGSQNLITSGGVKPAETAAKQLKSYLIESQNNKLLDAEIYFSPIIAGGYLNIASPYQYKSGNADVCVIDISAYKGQTLKVKAINGTTTIAFLQNNTLVFGQTPSYSSDYTIPLVINNEKSTSYIIPDDGNYLYVLLREGTTDKTPAVSINGLGNPVSISGEYGKDNIYIDTLWFDKATGTQNRIIVNETFNFGSLGNASEILVLSENDVVSIKPLSSVLDTDIILLIWGRTENDYYYGALYDHYLYYKTTATEKLANNLDDRVEAIGDGKIKIAEPTEVSGYLNIVSPYEFKSNNSDYGGLIDVSNYKRKRLVAKAVNGTTTIAFLQNNSLTLGQAPSYSSDYNHPIVINSGNSRNCVIPLDCNYLYVLIRSGNTKLEPDVFIKNIPLNPMAITGEYEKNSVYIDTLWLDTTNGGLQAKIIVNDTFNFGSLGNASEILVLSENDVVSIKPLSSVLDSDIILLAWGRTENDYYYGALYDHYLYYKTTATENLAKELDGRVNALENGAISPSDEISGYLNINSPYEYKSGNAGFCLIDISNYKKRELKVEAVNGETTIAFLQNNSLTLGQAPSYSSDYNHPIVVQSNSTVFYTIPSDCNYLYTLVRSGSTNRTPNILIKYGKTAILNFRIGGIALADGKPYVGYTSARIGDIKKMMIADQYLELENGDTIDSISGIDSSETLGYACFDSDFNLIGFNSSVLSGSKYVRLYCAKSENEYTHNSKNIIVSVSRNKDIELNCVKCGSELVTSGIIWFTYPIHNTTYGNDTANTNTYEGDNTEIVLNNGYVILPPNYSRNGKPCPVVVHCHGTGGVTWRKSAMPYITYNQDYLNFIAKNGYIVIGCCTTTELYAADYRDADVATPLTYSAFVELFRYVVDNFNADANRVSIFGYSSGGIMANMLGRLQPFKINSIASLAGALDYANGGRVLSPLDGDVNILSNTLNAIPITDQPSYYSSDGMHGIMDAFMIQRFIEYKDNICGLSPLFMGLSGIKIEDLMEELYSTYDATANYDSNTALQELVSQGRIICNVPIKIWHAIDDANVAYAISKMYVDMIHRAGGYAKLRTFPTGCGKHNAVGNSTNTTNVPFMDYVTTFGETINVPVAYGELVDWFNKWNN